MIFMISGEKLHPQGLGDSEEAGKRVLKIDYLLKLIAKASDFSGAFIAICGFSLCLCVAVAD